MKLRLVLRDLFWITLAAALAIGWFSDHLRFQNRLKKRDEYWRRSWARQFTVDPSYDWEKDFNEHQAKAP